MPGAPPAVEAELEAAELEAAEEESSESSLSSDSELLEDPLVPFRAKGT